MKMKFPSELSLTCPVIIMRTGGLDGVALQVREYRYLLNKLNIHVFAITGRFEAVNGPFDPIGHKQTVVPRLNFHHADSARLFANLFTHGPEKNGVEEISDEQWIELFYLHKNRIKRKIGSILKKIPHDTPVFVFNLLSLRHAHPAAAVALKELIEANPQRGFISHAADPDAERPEKIERVKKPLLQFISANYPSETYCGGPYDLPNLYHIVLNPNQKDRFINKYGVAKRKVFEIPDFLEFRTTRPIVNDAPGVIFMDYLSDRALKRDGEGYAYHRRKARKSDLFFLSPVRPVYRKRLKEAMLVAQQYGKSRNVNVNFVVTHPNGDDETYFLETVDFAEKLGLPYYHLGEHFSLRTLEDVYDRFAPLNVIGVVASSSGGWENALNEMARACIPFHMDVNLNSFKPLTRKIGIRTHGTDFSKFTDIIQSAPPEKLRNEDFSKNQEMKAPFKWFDLLRDDEQRRKIIKHNFKKTYNYLSHKAIKPRLKKLLLRVYRDVGIPPELEALFETLS